jgi:pimeloyl-ACP methyl ester carboxylesterase
MTPPRATRTLVGKAADARVVTVRSGHALHNEAPEEVLQALRDFVSAAR